MRSPTVTLLVRRRAETGTDPLGAPVWSWGEPEAVAGCLIAPGTPEGISASRPDGATVAATAHFPRGYSEELRGAQVSADGSSWLDVDGDPRPFPDGAVPGRWATMVLLESTEG